MLRISKIAFPGLGIGEFSVNSVAFKIGDMEIAWYAIIITLGMIACCAYTVWRCKSIGIGSDDVIDYALFAIPIGVIGARLYYVLTTLDEIQYKTIGDVFNIRGGGLAIYGGIIAGGITVYIVSRVKKISFLSFADAVCPGIILAQAVGRWGNFMNGEAFGYETGIFCRMQLENVLTGGVPLCVHPTFFYESFWNVIGFVLINLVFTKRKYDGQIFLAVFGWYGLGRMFIEGLRTDSLYIHPFGLDLRISQVLGGAIFAVCAALLIVFAVKKISRPLFFKESKNKEK